MTPVELLAKQLAKLDLIWQIGEDGVVAVSPEMIDPLFERLWGDVGNREKFLYMAEALLSAQL